MLQRNEEIQFIAASTSSLLSIIGSIYIISRYWRTRYLNSRFAVYDSIGEQVNLQQPVLSTEEILVAPSCASTTSLPLSSNYLYLDVTKELVHRLAWLDLIGAIARSFSVLPTLSYDSHYGEPVSFVCQLQAFSITFADNANVAWTLVMAHNLYRWVCIGEDQVILQSRLKFYLCGTIIYAVTISVVALLAHVYGNARQWCWVVVPNEQARNMFWEISVLYLWVVIGISIMAYLLFLVRIDLRKRLAHGHNSYESNRAYHNVVKNMTKYILAFALLWMPAMLDRVYTMIFQRQNVILGFLHAGLVPLQGFVNAMIYGKFHTYLFRILGWKSAFHRMTFAFCTIRKNMHTRLERKSSSGECRKSLRMYLQRASKCICQVAKTSPNISVSKESNGRKRIRECLESVADNTNRFGTASIFITTFDMAWKPLPCNLEDWIVTQKDLYVFALQNCPSVHDVEKSLRQYLECSNAPIRYQATISVATMGSRGLSHSQEACALQIIFASSDDVASGSAIIPSIGRAQAHKSTIRDTVGIPIRYFDASIAFVSSDLSAVLSAALKNTVANPTGGLTGIDAVTLAFADPDFVPMKDALLHPIDISAKKAVAMRLIQSFRMDSEHAAIDFPYLYHHTFIMGNLNFDIRASSSEALTRGMTQASKAECLKRSTDQIIENIVHKSACIQYNMPKVEDFVERKCQADNHQIARTKHDANKDYVYTEVWTAYDDELQYTFVHSPRSRDDMSLLGSKWDEELVSDALAWEDFLDWNFPVKAVEDTSSICDSHNAGNFRRQATLKSESNVRGIERTDQRKWRDLLSRSTILEETTRRKWQELVRYDELRIAMEEKEVFCGFEEPAIQFLPSFPRRVGVAVEYHILHPDACSSAFVVEECDGSSKGRHSCMRDTLQPAYKDRIISHSLQDTKPRLRNIGYWIAEHIITSMHKPVCSLYELEIDRLCVHKLKSAASEPLAAKTCAADKRGVQEYRFHLVNLDANLWTYASTKMETTRVKEAQSILNLSSLSDPAQRSTHTITGMQDSEPFRTKDSTTDKPDKGSPLDSRNRRGQTHHTAQKRAVRSARPRADIFSPATWGWSINCNGLITSDYDLAPLAPTQITTTFPLPSEDPFAQQRKVYEVAHAVEAGFQKSWKDSDTEETELKYINSRTYSWREACNRGIRHHTLARAVNGVLHVAINIQAEKDCGGQGVLCIPEEQLLGSGNGEKQSPIRIPFDLTLTWGGRHVGFLHGDILSLPYD